MELTLDQALQKGIEAHKAGNVHEADQYYTAILKANPKHPDANHNMGVLAVGLGKVEAALPFFKTALETNKSMAQYWLSYIDALIKLGRFKDAKDIPIEERNSEELSHVEGIDENNKVKKVLIYPEKSKAMNLAFDVTPAKYVTGLITERGVSKASSEGLKKLFK